MIRVAGRFTDGYAKLPSKVRLEASSTCQLACPSCPTTTGAARPAIARGQLTARDFARFLDVSPSVRSVELSNYGEVLLNKELKGILEIATRRGIAISMENGVNLNHLGVGVAEALVAARVRSICCSIDGATQETYAKYRVNGRLDRVLANVDAINAAKVRHSSVHPKLIWQFVVFGHNEREIPAARKMAEARGMSFRTKLSWDERFSPIRDAAFVASQTGMPATRAAFRDRSGRPLMSGICRQLWREPQFNWNGDFLGCCRNFWGNFGGNVLEDGMASTFQNPKVRRARRLLMGKKVRADDLPCVTCDLYLDMKAAGRFITAEQISRS
jgi:hypothetical protein